MSPCPFLKKIYNILLPKNKLKNQKGQKLKKMMTLIYMRRSYSRKNPFEVCVPRLVGWVKGIQTLQRGSKDRTFSHIRQSNFPVYWEGSLYLWIFDIDPKKKKDILHLFLRTDIVNKCKISPLHSWRVGIISVPSHMCHIYGCVGSWSCSSPCAQRWGSSRNLRSDLAHTLCHAHYCEKVPTLGLYPYIHDEPLNT